jgi:hypothetical protein
MKIPLKAITVTYTRTLTISPTEDIFEIRSKAFQIMLLMNEAEHDL